MEPASSLEQEAEQLRQPSVRLRVSWGGRFTEVRGTCSRGRAMPLARASAQAAAAGRPSARRRSPTCTARVPLPQPLPPRLLPPP